MLLLLHHSQQSHSAAAAAAAAGSASAAAAAAAVASQQVNCRCHKTPPRSPQETPQAAAAHMLQQKIPVLSAEVPVQRASSGCDPDRLKQAAAGRRHPATAEGWLTVHSTAHPQPTALLLLPPLHSKQTLLPSCAGQQPWGPANCCCSNLPPWQQQLLLLLLLMVVLVVVVGSCLRVAVDGRLLLDVGLASTAGLYNTGGGVGDDMCTLLPPTPLLSRLNRAAAAAATTTEAVCMGLPGSCPSMSGTTATP